VILKQELQSVLDNNIKKWWRVPKLMGWIKANDAV
jgi:hypothetical protein